MFRPRFVGCANNLLRPLLLCSAVLFMLVLSTPAAASDCARMQSGSLCLGQQQGGRSLNLDLIERIRGQGELACENVECPDWGQICRLGICFTSDQSLPQDCSQITCPQGKACYLGQCYPLATCPDGQCYPVQCGWHGTDWQCAGGESCVNFRCVTDSRLARMEEREHYRRGSTRLAHGRTGIGQYCPDGMVRVDNGACLTLDEGPCRGCAAGEICSFGRCWRPATAAACSGVQCPPRSECLSGLCVPSRR